VATKSENEFDPGLAGDGTNARSGAAGPGRFAIAILNLNLASPSCNIFHPPMTLHVARKFTPEMQPAQKFPFAERRAP